MSQPPREKVYSIIALICAAWFLLTAWLWTYLANLFISFPVGIIALLLWLRGKRLNPSGKLNSIVLWVLIAGALWSAVAFCLFYFNVW